MKFRLAFHKIEGRKTEMYRQTLCLAGWLAGWRHPIYDDDVMITEQPPTRMFFATMFVLQSVSLTSNSTLQLPKEQKAKEWRKH